MGVLFEPMVFQVRAGPNLEKHGDPFTTSGTVIVFGERATLSGLTADDVWNYREAFFAKLRELGVKKVEWVRIKNGKQRYVELKI